MSRRAALVAAFAGLLAASADRGVRAEDAGPSGAWIPPGPGVHETVIRIAPFQTVYPLGHPMILPGSDTVRVRDRILVPGRDYFLAAAPGELRLVRPLAPGDSVLVRYRALLAGPRGTFARFRVLPLTPGSTNPSSGATDSTQAQASGARAPARLVPLDRGPGPELNLTGNKTVAVDFGSSRDVALRQTLDLNVTGRLASDVDVIAVLSDRNTPVSAEGGTRELRELDKVLVQVRAPEGAATLGDYTLRQERGQFALWTRELTGVQAEGAVQLGRGRAALASSKGEFVSRQFQGIEGRQGPYLLSDAAGRTGISVVAGSEVVWLDGQRLTRGESADYAIDYDRGQITFTSRRLVSSSSRIAVDYQVALSAFRRNLAAFTGQATRGKAELYGHFFREADDRARPLRTVLSDEDRGVLALAGDSTQVALGSGVSPGPGDYDAVSDTAGVTHFAFAGIDSGDFRVVFASIGAGRGDYAESTQVSGRTVFRFVGPGAGSFQPGRALPLAASHSVAGGGFLVEPLPGARLEAEAAVSRFDANTFSSRDDADDVGTAGRARLTLERPLSMFGTSLGKASLAGGVRRFDRRYRAVGRIEEAFFEEEWGVNIDRSLDARDRRDVGASWSPVGALTLDAGYAELRATGGFFARRRSAGGAWNGSAFSSRGRVERVDNRVRESSVRTEGYRNKLVWNASSTALSWLVPTLSVDLEDRVPPGTSDSAAVRYRAWDAGARFPRVLGIDVGGGVGYRRDFSRGAGEWFPRTTAWSSRGAASGTWGGLSGAIGVERRTLRPEGLTAGSRTASDAGYARLRHALGSRTGSQELSFEWTGEAEELRRREVRPVAPGTGAYDSLGNFTGRGDYDVVTVATGSFRRLVRTSGQYRLEAPLAGWFADSSAWGHRLQGSRAGLLLQATLGRRAPFAFADLVYGPSRVLGREDVASGSYTIRPEIEVGPQSRWAAVLVRVERRATADRQFEGSFLTRDEWIEEARWRARPDVRWLGETTLRASQSRARQGLTSGSALARRLTARSAQSELTYLPNPIWRLGAVASYDHADLEDDGDGPSQVLRAGPRIVYSRGGRLRAELVVRRAAIRGGALPALVPTGFPEFPDTWDYTFETSLRVRERANLVLSGNGHERRAEDWVHTGRAELRAYF